MLLFKPPVLVNAQSLHLASVDAVCVFLQAAKLKNFLLLCKEHILIARFSCDELSLAKDTFHAKEVQTPETDRVIAIYFASVASDKTV